MIPLWNKQELEFVKDHGSNNQLFLTLRKQITIIQKTDKKIHDMSSAINEIDMEFKEIKNVNIETIGSLSQITRPCPIKYKSMKAQHEQVEVDRSQTLTEFIKEDEINLPPGKRYDLTDMAVTSDNKLLLCNHASSHPKVYIYKEGGRDGCRMVLYVSEFVTNFQIRIIISNRRQR